MESNTNKDRAALAEDHLEAVSSSNRARRGMKVVTVTAVADSTEVGSPLPPKRVRVQHDGSDTDQEEREDRDEREDREGDSDVSNSVYHDFVNSDDIAFESGSTSSANGNEDGNGGGGEGGSKGGAARRGNEEDDSQYEDDDDDDDDDDIDAFIADEYDDPDGNDPDSADPDEGEGAGAVRVAIRAPLRGTGRGDVRGDVRGPVRGAVSGPLAAASQSKAINIATGADSSVDSSDDLLAAAGIESTSSSSSSTDLDDDIDIPTGELREFKRIPIFIVDYHNDVLEFLYRCFATRHLPFRNNILVHFDSHPDMVISRELPASYTTDKDTMLSELSIENWIMPTCYAGHFNRVVWLKNSWCTQIEVGTYNFKIGDKNDMINVDCPLTYFISEGTYCATNDLKHARPVELQVHNADTNDLDPQQFLSTADATSFVLDIDLDFFSTSNPFLRIYKNANCYEQLTEIFRYEPNPNDCVATTEWRKQQLAALKRIFEHLEDARNFDTLPKPNPAHVSEETVDRIRALAKSLAQCYSDDEIDWLLVFDSGSTTDNRGLPHHNSTHEELMEYFGYFERFLKRLPIPPIAITMACSTEDDYCPKHQVAFIQKEVLRMLRERFGEKLSDKPILQYKDEVWDIMEL